MQISESARMGIERLANVALLTALILISVAGLWEVIPKLGRRLPCPKVEK